MRNFRTLRDNPYAMVSLRNSILLALGTAALALLFGALAAYSLSRVRNRRYGFRFHGGSRLRGCLVGLGGCGRRPGVELSGGQQQRVALARAIASRPQLFLLYEPLSNLDARLRLEARTFLKRLQPELGVTTVFVTHDQAEAIALADRIAVMDAGRIRQLGTPREVFQRPANTFVANFIGSTPMNLLDAAVAGDGVRVGGTVLKLPEAAQGQVADGEPVVLGVRPEHLEASASGESGSLHGTVLVVEDLGTSARMSVEVGDTTVAATVPDGSEPEMGAEVWLTPLPGRTLLYRAGHGELIRAASVRAPAARTAAS